MPLDPSPAGTPPGRPLSIFVVDDNAELAGALQRWFTRLSHFRWAGWLPTPEGLDGALAAVVPDILLLDWDLPGTDTGALLARLTRSFPNIRIAVLSAHLEPGDITAALAAGAAGYLSKVQSPADLAAEVRLVGEGRRILSQEAQRAVEGGAGPGTE